MKIIQFICALIGLLLATLPLEKPASANRIRLVVWGVESTAETKDVDAEIAAFEQMHPNITVETLSMGAGARNPQKLMTAIVGGVPPDLVQQDRFTIGDWASRGAFRPLDDLLQADANSSNSLAIRQRNFIPAAWAEATYANHVYAIPNTADDRLLYYNKALFREVGLDPAKPPRTWDEMLDDAKKLTQQDPSGGFERVGIVPLFSQGCWLYLWGWQEDGEFVSSDGRRCTMDNPRVVKALQAVVSWYDQQGGLDKISAFAGGFGGDEEDPFITGKLGMRIDTDTYVNNLARYGPGLDFGVAPIPVPAERFRHEGIFKHDSTWVTGSGGFSLVIPRGAKHVKEAWELIQWMTSPQAAMIGAKAQSAYQHSIGRLYVPGLSGNSIANKMVFAAYNGTLPQKYRDTKTLALSLLSVTRFRPVTFVGQRLWDEQMRTADSATRHNQTPEQALASAQQQVQIELDSAFNRDKRPPLPVAPVVAAILVLLLIGCGVAGLGVRHWMNLRAPSARAEARSGLLFALPWILGFLVFTFGPIIASLVLSFCDYDVLHPPRWAGLANYISLVTIDRPMVMKSLGNALYLAIFGIPLSMVTSLSIAMLLNTKVRGLHWYRTAIYVPSIVPIVATTVLWGWILNSDPHRGLVNAVWLATITHWFGAAPPGWEAVPTWAKPGLVLMGLWGAGGGMILWLAGLQSIPRQLYEAASLDGAAWWSQFRHITLPMLSPYIFFNLIMGTIGALQTFETTYILGNSGDGGSTGPDDSLLVPVGYLFTNAFQYFKMGYASALAWLLFILILGLTLGQLKFAPRWVHYESEAK